MIIKSSKRGGTWLLIFVLVALAGCLAIEFVGKTHLNSANQSVVVNNTTNSTEVNNKTTPKNDRTAHNNNPVPKIASASSVPTPKSNTLLTKAHKQYKYVALMSQPTGTLYSLQPFLSRISAPTAWSLFNNTNSAPTIAIIDTGVDLSHEVLQNRLTVARWDFVHSDNDPSAGTDNTHGAGVTHGTITSGLASMLNPNAKIMPVQVLDDDGVGYTDNVASGITYAADNGANIISLSLGGDVDDQVLHDAVDYAVNKGVLVVAAAGNSGCDCMSYPANYSEVLAVGTTDKNDNRASFSSYGANLDIMAPGVAGDVCSSVYDPLNTTNEYSCSYSGTSLSTPIVSGLAALLWQQNSSLSASQLITEIISRADHPSGMSGAVFSSQFGYGRINAGSGVSALTLAGPYGALISKHYIILSDTTPFHSPAVTSTCFGVPAATCTITLYGPNGETVSLGAMTLSSYGSAGVDWNALTLNLATGTWRVSAAEVANGQTVTSATDKFTITN